jgi:hypothetical protein
MRWTMTFPLLRKRMQDWYHPGKGMEFDITAKPALLQKLRREGAVSIT